MTNPAEVSPAVNRQPNLAHRFIDFLYAVISPLLPALSGGGLVLTLLTLLTAAGLLSESSPTYIILHVIGDAPFYFLPILLAGSLAQRLGCSRPLAMVTGAILVHPDLSALLAGGGAAFLTLPLHAAVYPSSVLPILLVLPLQMAVERLADRFLPSSLRGLLKPFLVLLLTVPIALWLIAPLGSIAGDHLAEGVSFLFARVPWLTLPLLAAIMPLLMLCGMHYALLHLSSLNLAEFGSDPLVVPAMFCAVLAQAGAALAVSLRSRDKAQRQTALGAGISAAVAGVSETALYGIILPLKTSLFAVALAAGAGGLYASLAGLSAVEIGGIPSVFTLLQMRGDDPADLYRGLIALAIVFLVSFGLTLLFYRIAPPKKRSSRERASRRRTASAKEASADGIGLAPAEAASSALAFSAPLSGKIVPLSQVDDPTFASGAMGQGCAIEPSEGKVYAPCDGRIATVADTCHAISIDSKEGAELLIHVGKDTTKLCGKHFDLCCRAGDEVKKGDLLLSFDLDAIRTEGYDLTTPLLIVNADRFDDLSLTCESKVSAGDRLLTLTSKE